MPPKRKRHNFFLRPNNAAELASALVSLESIVGLISIDLDDNGLELQGVGSAQISMVHLVVPASAFRDYTIESRTHIDLGTAEIKRVFSNTTTDFVFYQLADDKDHVVIEKIDLGAKWTIGIREVQLDNFTFPLMTLHASHSYKTGRELANSFIELKNAMKPGGGDTVEFEAARSAGDSHWYVRCEGDVTRLSQRLKIGTSEVSTPLKMEVSGDYLLTFLQVATISKGPTALRIVEFPSNRSNLFGIRLESSDRDFELNLFLAPKILDE